jgi:hypothetical protein
MTETPRSPASTRKSSAPTKAAASEAAAAKPAGTPATTATTDTARPAERADGHTAPGARTPMTLTIRLPFFTATFSGPGSAPPAGAPLAPVVPAPGRSDPGGMLEKMAFYGGIAAAGALGALEWPVAAAVAAGTWVAQHTPPPAGLMRGPRPRTEDRTPAEPERIAVTSGS